jgi:hypothetical protein
MVCNGRANNNNNGYKCQICRFLKIRDQTHDRRDNNLTFPNIIYDFLDLPLLTTHPKYKGLLLHLIIALNDTHTW